MLLSPHIMTEELTRRSEIPVTMHLRPGESMDDAVVRAAWFAIRQGVTVKFDVGVGGGSMDMQNARGVLTPEIIYKRIGKLAINALKNPGEADHIREEIEWARNLGADLHGPDFLKPFGE